MPLAVHGFRYFSMTDDDELIHPDLVSRKKKPYLFLGHNLLQSETCFLIIKQHSL